MKSRLVLLGPPASGKGTLAAALSRHLQIPAVSTGAILRQEKERGTDLGRVAASYTDRGLYFPDEVALQIVQAWLDAHGPRFLFDGFPRSLPQAHTFAEMLNHLDAPLEAVLSLEVSAEEIYRRVADRLTCASCGRTYSATRENRQMGDACERPNCPGHLVRRADDQLHVVENRLQQHQALTEPLLEYYQDCGLLKRIDGTGTPDAVRRRTLAQLA